MISSSLAEIHPHDGASPFFAVWPGRIASGVSDAPVINQDMVATFAALVGTDIPVGQAQDSQNLLPLLTGEGCFRPRETLVQQAGSRNQVMLRKRHWKLVIQTNYKRTAFDPLALFNLADDPGEKNDRLGDAGQADRVQQMFDQYMEIVSSGRSTVSRAE